MAILNNNVSSLISYTGSTLVGSKNVSGVNYNFYYGNLDINVYGNFGEVSVYCYYHGYMGGENLLTYSTICRPSDLTSYQDASFTNVDISGNLKINNSEIALKSDISSAISNLIDGAPGNLDTLNELATALGDDSNFASIITNRLTNIDVSINDLILNGSANQTVNLTDYQDASFNNVDISGILKINDYSFPQYSSGTGGQVLKLNMNATHLEWADVSGSTIVNSNNNTTTSNISGNILQLGGNLLFDNIDMINGVLNLQPTYTSNDLNNMDISLNNVDISGILQGNQGTQIRLGSHIIPTSNEAFDLGSAEYKIRHLFLSDNSLWIGDDHKIDISNGELKFKKRKKDFIPQKIKELSNSLNSIDDIKQLSNNFNHINDLSSMKLNDWLLVNKELKKLNPTIPELYIEDIFNDSSENWDQDLNQNEKIVELENKIQVLENSGGGGGTTTIAARQSYKHVTNLAFNIDYVIGYLSGSDYCETQFEYPSGFVTSLSSNGQNTTSGGGQSRGGYFKIPSDGVYNIYGIVHFNLSIEGANIILWYKRGAAAAVKIAENYKQNNNSTHEQSISLNINSLFDAINDDLIYMTIGNPNSGATTRIMPQGGDSAGIYFQIHKI